MKEVEKLRELYIVKEKNDFSLKIKIVLVYIWMCGKRLLILF